MIDEGHSKTFDHRKSIDLHKLFFPILGFFKNFGQYFESKVGTLNLYRYIFPLTQNYLLDMNQSKYLQ